MDLVEGDHTLTIAMLEHIKIVYIALINCWHAAMQDLDFDNIADRTRTQHIVPQIVVHKFGVHNIYASE